MAKSADEVLKELASGEITIKDVLKISLSKTETAEILNNIVDKLGSWEALKDYAKFLSKKGVLNKKSSLKTYIGKKKEAKKQKIAKEKEEGESESEEDEEDIEEIETEDESEEDESEEDVESGEEEEEQTEIKPMLSKEEFEKAKLLAERIKREKEDTHKKESTPREPVIKYTTKPAEGGEIPVPIPAILPVESHRFFNICKKEYRSAVWLNSSTKRVTVVYTDDPNYGTNASVKYGGKVWYMVNDLYFKLQCNSRNKKQFQDDGFLQFTDKDGNIVQMDILYGFSDGTYAKQTRDMFNLETNYFIEKFATPTQKKDLLTARPFSLVGSETTNLARKIGKSKLALIPNSEEVELSIANDGNDTIHTYFKKVANLYVFLDEDSVFAQRLQMNYYKNIDVLSLPVSERIDYPELASYYENVAAYELDEMGWELYYMEYAGGKDIKRIRPEKPEKPVIEGENKDANKIEYKKSLFSIKNMKRKFQSQEYIIEDESGKSVNIEQDTEFIKKIMNMNTEVAEKPKEKKVKILDIFDILKVHLQMLRNGEIPKLDISKSQDICDYCDTHVGENSEFKSVVVNDQKETEIVKYCSINCFNKSPED